RSPQRATGTRLVPLGRGGRRDPQPLTLHYLGAMRAQYQVAINSCCLLISRF
ncbi:unnamed protein product, partial [Ascophyllum nodosum]